MKAFVTFGTHLFNHTVIHDDFTNRCCFGEDVVVWLKARIDGSTLSVGEPIQEDYGWGFWVVSGRDRFWVCASTFDAECGDAIAEWGIVVASDAVLNPIARLLRRPDQEAFSALCARIDETLYTEQQIRGVEWWDGDFHVGTGQPHPSDQRRS